MATPCDIYFQSFKSYLGPPAIEGFQNTQAFRKDARGKLQKLPQEHFIDLTTDVYDELVRRSKGSKKMPYLPPSKNFSIKRNQARQKLGTLSDNRFKDLVSDLFIDLLIRFPELDSTLRSSIKDSPESGSRAPPYLSPPSSLRSSIFDLSNIMNDILDKGLSGIKEKPASPPISPDFEADKSKHESAISSTLRFNPETEIKLSKSNSALSYKSDHNQSIELDSIAFQDDSELLKKDYQRLRQEHERAIVRLRKARSVADTLTAENEKLKETIVELVQKKEIQEKPTAPPVMGTPKLASDYAELQKKHEELKKEYQKEMEDLRQRYKELEASHTRHLSVIETFGKNNEILELKLQQVNKALEASQPSVITVDPFIEDSMVFLKNGPPIVSPTDNSDDFLISDTLIQELRSSVGQFLEAARNESAEEVQNLSQSLSKQGQQIIETVEKFQKEVSDSKAPSILRIARQKEHLNSTISDLKNLVPSSSKPLPLYNELEDAASRLARTAESLQTLLQTNFCSLPLFSVHGNKGLDKMPFANSSMEDSLKNSRKSSFSSVHDVRKPSSYESKSFSPNTNFNRILRPYSVTSDDLMLEPLREYLEEQTVNIIYTIDHILGYIRVDDFSLELTEKVASVFNKVQQMLLETRQYSAVPHLQDSPQLTGVINSLAVANKTFMELHGDLEPLTKADDLITGDSSEPKLKDLKQRLASAAFELARHIKALLQSVS